MPKKYQTLRNKLRERIKAEKPIRTYKRREPGEEKSVYKVDRDSYLKRHEFCFNARDIQEELKVPGALGLFERRPQDFAPSCNHPEDGLCVKRYPTDEELKLVNEKLSGRATSPPGEKEIENILKEITKVRRPRKSKSEKPPAKYFCLKHETWHIDDGHNKEYASDMKYKRGRGRPKK